MTSVVSLQLDGNDLNEQITKLFPKCRPRDLNLNPVHDDLLDNNAFMMDLDKEISRCGGNEKTEEIQEEEEENGSQENDSSSNEEGDFNNEDFVVDHTYSGSEGQVIVLQSSKGSTYKLRDSRIIEIAGGRELFSQSRTKALRNKPRCSNEQAAADISEKTLIIKNKSFLNKNVWNLENEKGINREITETVFSTEIHSVKHQSSSDTPVTLQSYSASGGGGGGGGINNLTGSSEVVVFDDIGDDNNSWRKESEIDGNGSKREKESVSSSPSPPSYHQTPLDFFKVANTSASAVKLQQETESGKGPKVIGGLPIAEYEGSPKRYWPRHSDPSQNVVHPSLPSAHSLLASPSQYPPRPGFPQRIVTITGGSDQSSAIKHSIDSVSLSRSGSNSTFDYLYEFSETRKVLEEFFKQADNVGSNTIQDFDELGYELRRQAGRGSAYVGLRLAKGVAAQEGNSQKSPQKSNNLPMPESQAQNSRDQDIIEHDNNFLDLSADSVSTEDLGDTEVGLQVGHSRNFTLSPETTDCDSNCGDLDSEVSLLLMDNNMVVQQVVQGEGDQNEESVLQGSETVRVYSSMPILEDGLSSGHASDTDNNNPTVILMKRQITEIEKEIIQRQNKKFGQIHILNGTSKVSESVSAVHKQTEKNVSTDEKHINNCKNNNKHNANRDSYENNPEIEAMDPLNSSQVTPPPPAPAPHRSFSVDTNSQDSVEAAIKDIRLTLQRTKTLPLKSPSSEEPNESSDSPIWVPRRQTREPEEYESRNSKNGSEEGGEDEEADTDLETDRLLGQQRTDDHGFYEDKSGWKKPKTRTVIPSSLINSTKMSSTPLKPSSSSVSMPIDSTPSIPPPSIIDSSSHSKPSPPIYADVSAPAPPTESGLMVESPLNKSPSPIKDNGVNVLASKTKKEKDGSKKKGRNKEVLIHEPSVLIEGVLFRARYLGSTQLICEGQPTKSTRMMQAEEAVSRIKAEAQISDRNDRKLVSLSNDSYSNLIDLTNFEIPRVNRSGEAIMVTDFDPKGSVTSKSLCSTTNSSSRGSSIDSDDNHDQSESENVARRRSLSKMINLKTELSLDNVGTVFRLLFLGSVEVDEEGGRKRRKRLKKSMVEEAVNKIKAPEGETQPSTEVDLFISTEKIMVLNTDLKEIMMDHALRTISYIADIGDLVVLMARRRYVPHDVEETSKSSRTPKMICHVFESEEAQFIAQSIGQAFQVAYMEFLKANGIEDHSFVKEMDYQEVLNSQEIFGDELQMFAKKEMQKEVVVPKAKSEILGVVIVESGWGSMLPTVVIANLAPSGAAARCGQLNIGDQIIAINGVSLVGLPLSTCQTYIKNTKNQTVVKLTVVPCAPVVEVKIKRPDTKYQLGFSVQNGVICSLLRGGIAERGGVRVGHRIIEINNQSVVAVPHEKIVNLLATSVGEILMKTMPTSMFRLLTGQETPLYI